MYSEEFKKLTLKYLNSENVCLATISKIYTNEFIESIKSRKDVILIEINPNNREEKYKFISKLIGKIHKAERYSSEPKRFNISSNKVSIITDHGEKHLIKKDDLWSCNCDFYNTNKICSHLLAFEEVTYKRK